MLFCEAPEFGVSFQQGLPYIFRGRHPFPPG